VLSAEGSGGAEEFVPLVPSDPGAAQGVVVDGIWPIAGSNRMAAVVREISRTQCRGDMNDLRLVSIMAQVKVAASRRRSSPVEPGPE
jgi:hypothetical protein